MTGYEIACVVTQSLTLFVLVGVLFYAYYGLRPALGQVKLMSEALDTERKTRFAELITHLAERWDSEQLANSRVAIQKAGKNLHKEIIEADENPDKMDRLITLFAVANFFDTMGVLIKLGYLDISTAESVFGEAAKGYFDLYNETLQNNKYKRFLTCYQYLVEELQKRKAEQPTNCNC